MRIYRSNDLEDLSRELGRLLQGSTLGDPMRAEVVVVHSPGVARWLSMQLAQALGVCANIEFPLPAKFVKDTFAGVLGDAAAGIEAWEPDRLRWPILEMLPDCLAKPGFEALLSYVGAAAVEPEASVSRRQVALASEIADVFDRYVTYRPDLDQLWSESRSRGGDNAWQRDLWAALRKRIRAPNIADLRAEFLTRLNAETPPLADIPQRICLFGVSSLPRFYIEVLAALARHVEVHLFALCPSEEYWGHIRTAAQQARETKRAGGELDIEDLHLETGHTLLASFGRLGRDFQVLLEGTVEHYTDGPDLFRDPGRETMLATLQTDMRELVQTGVDPGLPRRFLAEEDRSVQLHSCHSPMRQVEVVRDVLVGLFDELEDLQPRDVVVMTPDVETYAPLIEAVFSDGDRPTEIRDASGAAGFPRLPYRIADRSLRRENAIADSILALLRLASSRVTASEVLGFLGMEPVRERFGLNADDLAQLSQWVAGSSIHWGIDEAHREQMDQPRDRHNTWRQGLDRLLLGYAMRGDGTHRFAGVLPYDDADHPPLLGSFVDACETIFENLGQLRAPKSVAEWRSAVATAMTRLLNVPVESRWQLQQVDDALADLTSSATAAAMTGKIDLDAFVALLERPFGLPTPVSNFLSGAITFCGMIPMRSLPFRVVVLMGMDDGAFPRRQIRAGFDLVAQHPELGDRNARDDDRYLMLEAILAVRERLVLTYTGRGIRDNEPLPPAVPVSELIDTLAISFQVAKSTDRDARESLEKRLVTQHPLQPFSGRNFAEKSPRSFDKRLLQAARRRRGTAVSPPVFIEDELPEPGRPADAISVVSLDDLARFFEEPVRYFFTRRLAIARSEEAIGIDDREPVALDGLEKYGIASDLLAWTLDGAAGLGDADKFAAVDASGRLPLGTAARCAYQDLEAATKPIAEKVTALREGGPVSPIAIDRRVGNTRLIGRIGDRWKGGRVEHSYARLTAKRQLAGWVRHVVAQVVAPHSVPTSHLVGRPANGAGALQISFAEVESADAVLATLLDIYHAGQRAPLPFFPEVSRVYAETLAKANPEDTEAAAEDEAVQNARSAWAKAGKQASFGGSQLDEFVARIFADRAPELFDDDLDWPGEYRFRALAREVWLPALAAMEKS